MTGRRGQGGDRGSLSTEFVLVGPLAIVLVAALLTLAGRLTESSMHLQTAAQRGARAATTEANEAQALSQAKQVAKANLDLLRVNCVGAPAISVVVVDAAGAGAAFEPGNFVSVEIVCHLALADLSMISVPGQRTVARQANEVIDRYRIGSS